MCGTLWQAKPSQFVPVDSASVCRDCGTSTPCPADAARVRCMGCGVFGPGPDLGDPARRGAFHAVGDLHRHELQMTHQLFLEQHETRPPEEN